VKHICAWCSRELPEDDEEPLNEVSHGICEECAEKMFEDIEEESKDA